MKIATYNVNGVNGRLEVLLRWLAEASPDIVCLQELKAPDMKFPVKEMEAAGYGVIWHGQKSWNGVAILAKGEQPHQTRKGLPGDATDVHSRYMEAAIRGILVGCLYLPNGNPWPGPKFDYKLSWFERLKKYADELLDLDIPVVLAGDYNVMPTEIDVYKPERWLDDAFSGRKCVTLSENLSSKVGRTPCASSTATGASTPFGTISGMLLRGTRDCASITASSARGSPPAFPPRGWTSTSADGITQATTRPYG